MVGTITAANDSARNCLTRKGLRALLAAREVCFVDIADNLLVQCILDDSYEPLTAVNKEFLGTGRTERSMSSSWEDNTSSNSASSMMDLDCTRGRYRSGA